MVSGMKILRSALLLNLCLLAAILPATAEESKVLTLTEKNFDDAVANHPFLVVEFYAPWCGHCKQLAPEYEKAAAALEGNMDAGIPITLGQVDATIERALGERFQVQGYPTLKVFTKGSDKPVDYDGPREADGIVSYLIKRAGPASTELVDTEKALEIKEKERVMVVLAGKVSDTWTTLADSMRDAVFWAHTSNKGVMGKLGIKDGVTVLKHFDEGTAVYKGSLTDESEIKAFVNLHRIPMVMAVKKGDQAALKIVFEDEKVPNAFLFLDTADDKLLATFKEGCTPSRGQFVTGYFTAGDFPEAFAHFGMDKVLEAKELPKVLIEDRKEGLRYMMEGTTITSAAVTKFLADYKAGSLEPFLKSEAVPESNSGPTRVIVGSTFQEEVNMSGKWTFLEVYAPWCGHCKKLMPVWDDLGEAFKDASDVVVAKVDATANDLPKSLGVQGFPTLLLFRGDGSAPKDYSGERDYAGLSAWLAKHTGAKPKTGYKPKSGDSAPASSAGVGLDKQIVRFLGADYQVPWMSEGYKVSGLYLAAICFFLLFIASIALVIACISGESVPKKPPTAPSKKKN